MPLRGQNAAETFVHFVQLLCDQAGIWLIMSEFDISRNAGQDITDNKAFAQAKIWQRKLT